MGRHRGRVVKSTVIDDKRDQNGGGSKPNRIILLSSCKKNLTAVSSA